MDEKLVDDNSSALNNEIHQFNIVNDNFELVFEASKKKKCCCKFCYYLFCCCCFNCCQSEENLQKNLFIAKWKDYVQHNNEKEDTDLPFLILTNLYTKNFNNALEQLHSIRINPNYLIKFRTDLEFYIPQLCTFLLFCGEKDLDEFFLFLCRACGLNLFFAHRVHWFLSAMLNDTQEKKNEIQNIISMLNTLFKSESTNEKTILKNFYIDKGDEYIQLIKQNNLNFLYNNSISENDFDEIDQSKLTFEQKKFYEKFKKSRMIIEKYSDIELTIEKNHKNLALTKEDEMILQYKFNPNDFYIDISNFKLLNNDYKIEDFEIEEDENNFDNINKVLDLNFISYFSSINFINHLCDLSNELPKYSEDEQMNFLYEEINKINKKLPCNVYLPFMSNKCRHYFILHIPLDGIKIFRTKTRTPIMLTFEICLLKDIVESAINNGEIIDDSKKSRSQTLNSQSLINTFNDNNEVKDDEILLCKPLKVTKNISSKTKKNKDILYDNDDEIEYENSEEKKFNMIKERLKIFNLNKKGIYFRKKNANTVFESIKPNILNSKNDDNKIEKKINDLEINTSSDKNENKTNINENKNNNDLIKEENNKTIIKNNNISNTIEIKNSFGETFKNKKKSIKLKSLFGKIKSHNIFRCIIKTNEDLRQEQFATQLINEFNQIFQITNSHCWLDTYEIISTGNNSGLVEMVNDSLSLDQLKQKLNGISLDNFYKSFFTGKQYDSAIENLCQSLAGYSLVCYFLQIKDRHNGNILIDIYGHIIHIDFGFLLSNAPGKGLKFENAPFKLTNDFVECLGGINGTNFRKFVNYLNEGFYNIHIHRQKIIILVEMMWCGHGTGLPCFENKQQTIDDLKERLCPSHFNKDSHGNIDKKDCFNFVNSLISQSVDNWRTKCYDWFQYKVQGIFY